MAGNENHERQGSSSIPKVRIKAWVECRGETLIGFGKGSLLEAVSKEGSISAAAKSLGLSYATAWHRIDSMGRALGSPLVRPRTGGKGGGGAVLTDEGEAVLDAFRFMKEKVEEVRLELEHGLFGILDRVTGTSALASGKRRDKRSRK